MFAAYQTGESCQFPFFPHVSRRLLSTLPRELQISHKITFYMHILHRSVKLSITVAEMIALGKKENSRTFDPPGLLSLAGFDTRLELGLR